ncbi:MAG: YXWGXW repeat-containing protein [Rhodocyclaceae bacterium]
MKPRLPTNIALLAAVLAAPALAGCVVTASTPGHVRHGPVVVVAAPPPPRVEVIGVAPYPGYVWIRGYWTWNGHRHHWAPGHWAAPRHGHRYVPHRWEKHNGHWREHPGRWEKHDDRRDRHDRHGRNDHRDRH